MHILRCDDKTSPLTYSAAPARGLPSKGEMRRKSDNILLTTNDYENKNIPPAPFKGGDATQKR